MHGYDVLTSEDEKVGQVVGESGDNLIVEQGAIFKSKRPLPRAFVHVDESAGVVRTTISKQLLEEAPKVEGDGDVDELEVARYYGLGEETPPNDPERTPDDDAHSARSAERRGGADRDDHPDGGGRRPSDVAGRDGGRPLPRRRVVGG